MPKYHKGRRGAGRPVADLSEVLRAVLYVLKEGVSWRAVDAPGVSWQAVYGHFRRWCLGGLWDQIMDKLTWHCRRRLVMADATHIKVHRDGANPAGGQAAQAMGRTKGGLNTKLHALYDDRAQPRGSSSRQDSRPMSPMPPACWSRPGRATSSWTAVTTATRCEI